MGPDYYEYCLLCAQRELKVQVAALVEQCGENSESNEAEATWVAAAVVEAVTAYLSDQNSPLNYSLISSCLKAATDPQSAKPAPIKGVISSEGENAQT